MNHGAEIWLKKAEDSLRDANILIEASSVDGARSRAAVAVIQAARSMQADDASAAGDDVFDFVYRCAKERRIEPAIAGILKEAKQVRLHADETIGWVTLEYAERFLKRAETFLEVVERKVNPAQATYGI